jgi:L-ascorbate metabolism protein UlaG (beta-lactamase superfamily)
MTRCRYHFSKLLAVVVVLVIRGQTAPGQEPSAARFVRGDADADGERNITDGIFMLGCSFLGTQCPSCADAADANDDGESNVTDPIFLLNALFSGGPVPPAPSDSCGPDPTADALDCGSYPPCAADPDAVPTARGDLIVIPIEHATLVLRWDGKAIYVDPVGGSGKFSGLPPPDIIVVTDIHSDHMDGATIRAVAVEGTVLVVPAAVSQSLAGGGVGSAELMVVANGEKVTAAGIEIEAIPMYNTTADRLRYHEKGRGNGYVLNLAGTRVYISGDTEDIPEMRALSDIALAFLCMNLPFTMTVQQAASAALEFQPRIVYPYHHRGQNPETFRSLVEAGSDAIEVRIRDWYPGS